MTGAIRSSQSLRALLCAFAALALAVRLLAPAGFMPVMTDHGVMVTLCTGQGAVQVMVERDQIPAPSDTGKHDGKMADHCPYAGGVSAPAIPALGVLGLLPVWHLPMGPIAFALKTGWIARLAAPPPPASGPPSTLD